jgi:hypothetical protein
LLFTNFYIKIALKYSFSINLYFKIVIDSAKVILFINKILKMAKEKVSKKELSEQDQKDAKQFLMWTAGITFGLVLLIYFLYSSSVG